MASRLARAGFPVSAIVHRGEIAPLTVGVGVLSAADLQADASVILVARPAEAITPLASAGNRIELELDSARPRRWLLETIAPLQTGTSSTPLPDLETREPGQRVVCHREPAAGVVVQVFASGARHQALTDAHGRLELRDVPPGAPRIFVDGAPVRFREEKVRPARVVLRAPVDAAETPTAETPAPKPTEKPRPELAPVVRPTDTSVLPPPPPPPPGVRLFPD